MFEYLEVDHSNVKRHWWGSEHHNIMRLEPCLIPFPGEGWTWSDDLWKIDCAGKCKVSPGGWESCASLVGGKSKYFSACRSYVPGHPFRRRRWFRRKINVSTDQTLFKDRKALLNWCNEPPNILNSLDKVPLMYYHRKGDSSSNENRKMVQDDVKIECDYNEKKDQYDGNDKATKTCLPDVATIGDDVSIKISIKVGDGIFSSPITIPPNGNSYGMVRCSASRWPQLTGDMDFEKDNFIKVKGMNGNDVTINTDSCSQRKEAYSIGALRPNGYDFTFHVSVLDGIWGEFSRLLIVQPRFMIRNDSKYLKMEIKQIGAASSLMIGKDMFIH